MDNPNDKQLWSSSPATNLIGFAMALICLVSIATYYYFKNKHSYWSRLGLKTPKPLPLVGNMLEFILRDTMEWQLDWQRQCGLVYGMYQGTKPTLVVADPKIVRQICIKHADVFEDHELFREFSNKYQKKFILLLEGASWRRVRAIMSPTFTSARIKRMYKLLDECATEVVSCFRDCASNVSNRVVNLKDLYCLYTIDGVLRSCYSIQLERKGYTDLKEASEKNDLVRECLKLFILNKSRIFVSLFCPKFILNALKFESTPEKEFDGIMNRLAKIIDHRRLTNQQPDDYLQLLLDARLSDENLELSDMDDKENHHVAMDKQNLVSDQAKMVQRIDLDEKRNKPKLTDLEIKSNAGMMMAVGVETTSNLLTTMSFILAFHQDVQTRLFEEVAKLAQHDENDKSTVRFEYEALTSCQYLDSVISESLRYITPILMIDRVANRDFQLEDTNGVTVRKGGRVIIAIHAIHHNPEFWPVPEKFDPMRFMPGNKDKIVPCSYLPFGTGPRHCLGMRFSLTETKLAIAKLLIKYRLEPAPGTSFPPKIKLHVAFASLKTPNVILVERLRN